MVNDILTHPAFLVLLGSLSGYILWILGARQKKKREDERDQKEKQQEIPVALQQIIDGYNKLVEKLQDDNKVAWEHSNEFKSTNGELQAKLSATMDGLQAALKERDKWKKEWEQLRGKCDKAKRQGN